MHEALLSAINHRGKSNDDQQLIQINKNLSETIAQVEARNQQLQAKLTQVKLYQRVFKHSQSMQCKFCQVFFPAEIFVDHVKTCSKDNRFSRSLFFQIPLSLAIKSTRVDNDPIDNRQYTEYVIHVVFNQKEWIVSQKYKAFCLLHEKLINQYPNIKFPQSSIHFTEKLIRGSVASKKCSSYNLIDERQKILQDYLQELALIPAIKESSHFKQFIGIDEHFPEFCNDYEQSTSGDNIFDKP